MSYVAIAKCKEKNCLKPESKFIQPVTIKKVLSAAAISTVAMIQ